MILVDTSVWVEHLRRGLPRLARLLQEGEALIHREIQRVLGYFIENLWHVCTLPDTSGAVK